MQSFSGDDFMVAWTSAATSTGNPSQDAVAVGPWPDRTRWSDEYVSTTGCCDAYFKGLTSERKTQCLVNLFVDLVLGHGLDPKAVHREFMKIDLWREMNIELPSGPYVAHLEDGNWSPHNP